MREMGVLNEKNELDFNSQKRALDQFNLPNKWFKNRLLNDMEVCNKMAESLPYDYTQQHNFPGLVNLSQVKSYLNCCKYSKMRTCMYKDVKDTWEKNFGSLDKIMEQTQLNEDQLFPLVTQLLHGEEMDYFGFQTTRLSMLPDYWNTEFSWEKEKPLLPNVFHLKPFNVIMINFMALYYARKTYK